MPISNEHRRRFGRNLALGLTLGALVVLFFVVSIVKMQGGHW